MRRYHAEQTARTIEQVLHHSDKQHCEILGILEGHDISLLYLMLSMKEIKITWKGKVITTDNFGEKDLFNLLTFERRKR